MTRSDRVGSPAGVAIVVAQRRAALGRVLLATLLLLLGVIPSVNLPPGGSASRIVPASLRDRVLREGHVRVIVELRLPGGPHVPEGRVPDVAAVQRQVLWRLVGRSHRVIHRYDGVPLIALEVGFDALAELEASPTWVARIVEDTPNAPTSLSVAPRLLLPKPALSPSTTPRPVTLTATGVAPINVTARANEGVAITSSTSGGLLEQWTNLRIWRDLTLTPLERIRLLVLGILDTFTPASSGQSPVITSLTAVPASILDTQTSQLSVMASDPDAGPQPLTYQWSVPAGAGSLSDATVAAPIFTPAPAPVPRMATLSVTVSDGANSTTRSVEVEILPGAGGDPEPRRMEVVQAQTAAATSPTRALAVSFAAPTTPGHALVVVASDLAADGGLDVAVSDSDAHTWSHATRASPIGPVLHDDGIVRLGRLFVWWTGNCSCSNTGGPTTVTLTAASARTMWVSILEVAYSGGVFDISRVTSQSEAALGAPSDSVYLGDAPPALVIGAVLGTRPYTPPPGFTLVDTSTLETARIAQVAYALTSDTGTMTTTWSAEIDGRWLLVNAAFTTRPAGTPSSTFSYGFAFRGTPWAVRDDNDTFGVTGDAYPLTYTNRNGNTVVAGFIQSGLPDTRGVGLGPLIQDLNLGDVVDRRLVGYNGYFDNNPPFAFKITGIPPGKYWIDLAFGAHDPFWAIVVPLIDVYDGDPGSPPPGTGVLLHIFCDGMFNDTYCDATGTTFSQPANAAWSGTPVTRTITSGTLTIWFPAKFHGYDCTIGANDCAANGYYDSACSSPTGPCLPYFNEHILLNYLRLTPVP